MSAVKQIKVGIIGCGVIAPCHIGSYLKLPEVRVVHLCDKVPAKAEKLAKEYGIGKVSQDYKELLADPEVMPFPFVRTMRAIRRLPSTP